ncbi:hypothetical protein Aduo_018820 [Ancylostoma duodenale]
MKLLEALKANRQEKSLEGNLLLLVDEFNEVFAVEDCELTQTYLLVHDIDIADHPPIKQRKKPNPLGARAELKTIIKGLLERGIIQRSLSEWASPVVLVKKKDGTLRVCIDYRELNKHTKQDSYPLPTIDNVLQSPSGMKYFSTLDMASGYCQIPLSEDAKKSAFTTSEGLFEFTVLPFGLSPSPARFQRLMDTVLGELKDKEVFVYIDDVLIATETEERHFEVLRMVLEALRRASLKLKPQKCKIMQTRVTFLGHELDSNGVHADPEKIARILGYPTPTKLAELRTFLGCAATTARALLCQKGKDGFLHPIFFTSKRLSKAEFHYFCYGMKVVTRTDHQPLLALFKRSNVSTRVLRWALEIQRYNVEIEYVKGLANQVADALSRGVSQVQPSTYETCAEDEKVVATMATSDSVMD